MHPIDVLTVGLCGSVGALARFVADGAIRARARGLIPLGTLLINLTGSLALGVLTGLVLDHGDPVALTLLAGTGFCGGYTTFSTASYETVRLLREGEHRVAAGYGAVTLLGTLGAAALGLALAAL